MDAPNSNAGHSPGVLQALLLLLIGVPCEAFAKCPPQERQEFYSASALMLAVFGYMAGLFCLFGHMVFAAPGEIKPSIIAVAIFISAFMVLIDRSILHLAWLMAGVRQLRQVGIDISRGLLGRVKAILLVAIRGVLSCGFAQLSALCLGLVVFQNDVNSRLEAAYVQANQHLLSRAAALVDSGIQRATDAVATQTTRVNELAVQVTALRQGEIDPLANDPRVQEIQHEITRLLGQQAKADEAVQAATSFAVNESGGIKGAPTNSGQAGNGPRFRAAMEQVKNAKARAEELARSLADARSRLDALRASATGEQKQQSRDQLPAFEDVLKRENAKLTGLKNELAALTEGRERAIRKAVEGAPDYVKRQSGFIAQVVVLKHMSQEDRTIAFVVLLLDVTAFGFDLALLMCAATHAPATHAASMARDEYLTAVRIGDELATEVNKRNSGPEGPPPLGSGPMGPPPPSSPPSAPSGNAAQPVKRKRGRPRKNPIVAPGLNGQGAPTDPPVAPATA